ncbi:MAG: hypothetical protein R6U96_04810 [Promethearchaeia archaeon]
MVLFRVKFTNEALDYISEKNKEVSISSDEEEKYVVAFFYYSATT